MNKNRKKQIAGLALTGLLTASLTGCSANTAAASAPASTAAASASAETTAAAETTPVSTPDFSTVQTVSVPVSVSGSALDTAELFTDRDLEQTADLTDAVYYTVQDGEDINITKEGVYVLTGTAENVTVKVAADDSAKVQLVLNGLTITNTSKPCIVVESADKVFVTTSAENSALTVSGEFADETYDAVVAASDDIVFNGAGTLTITSSVDGIDGKDDVKITGGTIIINSDDDALEANDSIRIAGGDITIKAGDDAVHAENEDDITLGYVYISGGTLDIEAADDGIHGETIVQVDGGTINVTAAEGLEATWVQINDGDITINATDDGINAANKSSAYTATLEINGGTITLVIGAGDTDALDSNGNLIINGGTIDITAQSPFDYDGQGQLNGGTVTVNGQQITTLTNAMMGGMMGGMQGGQMPQNGQIPQDGQMPQDGSQGQMPNGQQPQGGPMGGGMPGGPMRP